MKLHKRTLPVQKARNELSMFVCDWIQKHGLTYGEVTGALAEVMATWAKYQIRDERHGDNLEGKQGDEA